jgi:hypothetical protein
MILDGDMPGVPGATIAIVASLPSLLTGAVRVGPHSQARPGALLRIVPGTARFLVTQGTAVAVAVDDAADPDDVASFLLGGVRGALIHQRGELPLHAATLFPPQGCGAVAITGASGMGKSTLAAQLVLRGWSLLADDLTRISWAESTALAWPGGTGIKLTRNAIDRLGLDAAALTRVAPAVDKMRFEVSPMAEPVSLAWVISLHRNPAPEIQMVAGSNALALLLEQTFRPHYIAALGVAKQHLLMVSRVAATCRCASLSGYRGVAVLADTLEKLVLQG